MIKLALQLLDEYKQQVWRANEVVNLQEQAIIDEFCTMKIGDVVVGNNGHPFYGGKFEVDYISLNEYHRSFNAFGYLVRHGGGLSSLRGRRFEKFPDV